MAASARHPDRDLDRRGRHRRGRRTQVVGHGRAADVFVPPRPCSRAGGDPRRRGDPPARTGCGRCGAGRRRLAPRRAGRDGPGPSQTSGLADDRPRARATPSARRLRPGCGRPLLPAVHRARPRRASASRGSCESSSASSPARRSWRGALPPVRRGDHLLAAARGGEGGCRARGRRLARGEPCAKLARALAEEHGRRARRAAGGGADRSRRGDAGGCGGRLRGRADALRDACASSGRSCSSSTTSTGARRPSSTSSSTSPTGSRDAPILLVCLARPELLDVRPGWGGGKLNATSVLLEPLSDDECGRLIENLVGRGRAGRGGRGRASRRPPRATRSSSRRCSRC